jgi:hypothetical protein
MMVALLAFSLVHAARGRDRDFPCGVAELPECFCTVWGVVPAEMDRLLVAGRAMSCDATTHSFMREVPECWMTGQAAGMAAVLAASRRVKPRDVPIAALQASLLKQGVLLHAGGLTPAEVVAT